MQPAVSVDAVGKRFWHHAPDTTRTWKDAALAGFRDLRKRRRFWALKDVSFDVRPGSTVGLMGPNGAGKSSLLRLIGGVGRPDEGRIEVVGRTGAIIELGTGFNGELTGRENVILGGVVGGLTRQAVIERSDAIVAFAELEDFIDEPVRTYSSGMVARLAFSLATHIDADVLLIDEVLSVGDISFQQRCIDRLKDFQRGGVTMVIVSHDAQILTDLCDEIVWLRSGSVVATGPPHEIAQRYRAAMVDQTRGVTPDDVAEAVTPDGVALRVHENRFGSQRAQVTCARVVDAFGRSVREIRSGEPVRVGLEVCIAPDLGDVHVGAHLLRADGVICLDTSTMIAAGSAREGRLDVRLDIDRLDLAAGDYAFDVGLYSTDWEETYDYHVQAYPVRVVGPQGGSGTLAPPLRWTTERDT